MPALNVAKQGAVRTSCSSKLQTVTPVVKAPAHATLDRRSVLSAAVGGLVALAAGKADAKDYKAMLAEKEARKAALRSATGNMRSTGQDKAQIFKSPEYSVSEEARTPNIHTRQDEGARTQENV